MLATGECARELLFAASLRMTEDRREKDKQAAKEATDRLRKNMGNDDAEIQAVY